MTDYRAASVQWDRMAAAALSGDGKAFEAAKAAFWKLMGRAGK